MKNVRLISLNIICVILVMCFSLLSWKNLTVSSEKFQSDYATFYKIFHEENALYKIYKSYDVVGINTNNVEKKILINNERSAINLNTPLMSLLLKKLVTVSTKLSINTLVWVLLSLGCAILSFFMLMQSIAEPSVDFVFSKVNLTSLYYFFPALSLLWLSWPALFNTGSGQIAFFLLPFLSVGFFLDQNKRYVISAAMLALLASLKIFFLIFILLYVIRRQFKLAVLFVITFLIFFYLPVITIGWREFQYFFVNTHLSWDIINRATSPLNGTIMGFVGNIFRLLKMKPALNEITIPAVILSLGVIVAWISYDYQVLRHLRRFKNELRFSFLIVLALICSPLGWIYYHVFLLIPVWIMLCIAKEISLTKRFYLYFFLALFLPYLTAIACIGAITEVIQRFSVFLSLLCWLQSLCILSRCIASQKKDESNAQYPILTLLIIYILCGVSLLFFNKGLPYFLSLNKTKYLDSTPSGVWMPGSQHE